jgi:hypothetical protein
VQVSYRAQNWFHRDARMGVKLPPTNGGYDEREDSHASP